MARMDEVFELTTLNTIILGVINALGMVILCKLKPGPQAIFQHSAACLKASFVNDSVM